MATARVQKRERERERENSQDDQFEMGDYYGICTRRNDVAGGTHK